MKNKEMLENIVEKASGINWKQKLSSRKLWAAALAAVLAILAAVLGEEIPADAVDVIRTGIHVLIAYIFGESAVDIARIFGDAKVEAAEKDACKTIDVKYPDSYFGEGTEGE